jgi:hypothetical protein
VSDGYPFIYFQDTAEYTLCLILGVPAPKELEKEEKEGRILALKNKKMEIEDQLRYLGVGS